MATLDKTSAREQVAQIKADFERLSQAGKVADEVKPLFTGLLLLVELILAIFLEKKTRKTSKNSGIPPSCDFKEETETLPGSKKKGHSNNGLAENVRSVESTTIIPVTECSNCGELLEGVECCGTERRTKIDIIFEKVTEHVDAEIKQCPTCGDTVKGDFPADMLGPLQYGNGLIAFAINLLTTQMVALNRVQKLLSSMIGTTLAEATLLRFILRLHRALEDWERQTKDQLLDMATLHVDETSFRVDKKNHWIHVYSSGGLTLKLLHQKRGKEAIEALNIIPRYSGVIIHDCWASYLAYAHCHHGLCGAHLLRELTYVIDSNNYRWAKNLKRLLQETCRKIAHNEARALSPADYANLQKRYRNLLTRGEKELPVIPPKPKGKRGKVAKSDAHNLWERFKKYETAVLLFAKEPHVPFTNNRAERDLRMAKVKQKVSGCFRAEQYAHAYCRISSYIQTMNQQGVNPLVAIQMALAGKLETKGE
jgi:transposase